MNKLKFHCRLHQLRSLLSHCIQSQNASTSLTAVMRLSAHMKAGLDHYGRFPTLGVVNHYHSCKTLGLGGREKSDLVEYLKSLPNNAKQEDRD